MKSSRILIIDILRIFATLIVVLFHFFPDNFNWGFIGVDIFFVISGYVIALSINNNVINSYTFFNKRLFRLYPALISAVIFSLILSIIFYSNKLIYTILITSFTSLGGVSNIFLGLTSNYFDIVSEINPLLHSWSLSVEWQFYFIISTLLLLKKQTKLYLITISLLTFLSVFLSLYIYDSRPNLNFYSIFSRFYEFGLGILFFHLKGFLNGKKLRYLIFILIILIFAFLNKIDGNIWPNETTILLTLLCGFLIVQFSEIKLGLIKKHVIWFSDRTYSFYLIHYPLASLFKYYQVENNLFSTLAILLSIIIANYNYLFIEKKYRFNYNQSKWFLHIFLALSSIGILISIYSQKNPDNIYSNYVKYHFNNHLFEKKRKEKQNIFIVGDSYAQDFTNILIDGLNINEERISTLFIDMNCGNLFIKETNKLNCINPDLENLIYELNTNDVLILSSNWLDWVIEDINISINNIRSTFNGPIIVVGTKHIGKQNPFLIESIKNKSSLSSTPPNYVIERNNRIKELIESIPNVYFINIQNSLLDKKGKGVVTDVNGKIISYDGGHLTKEGVIYVAKNLKILYPFLHEIF